MAAKKKTSAAKNSPQGKKSAKSTKKVKNDLEIRFLDVSALIPYENNAKTHSDEQIQKIAESITEFGFTNPILIGPDNGIIAGHGRLAAANLLKMAKVPTIELGYLSEDQKRAYIIADNRLTEVGSDWDLELLSQELDALKSTGFNIDLTGFDESHIIKEIDPEKDEKLPDMLPDPVSTPGDVWELGQNTLVCGSATNPDDWLKLRIDSDYVIITSPPYNLGHSATLRSGKEKSGKQRKSRTYNQFDDNLSDSDYSKLIQDSLAAGLNHCTCAAYNLQMLKGSKTPLLQWMADNSSRIIDVITWDKKNGAPNINPGVMSAQFEWIFLISGTDNATKVVPYSSWHGKFSNVFTQTTGHNEFADLHKAVFPVELPSFLAGDLMNRCRGIVDCFNGTGTCIIAGEKLGKRACGIEIDPLYVDLTVMRWQEFTGHQAIHNKTGLTFSELAKKRNVRIPVSND